MKPIGQVLADMDWPAKLADLARRVDRNVPDSRDPERFHAEKSEIVNDLNRVSRCLRSL